MILFIFCTDNSPGEVLFLFVSVIRLLDISLGTRGTKEFFAFPGANKHTSDKDMLLWQMVSRIKGFIFKNALK